MTLINQRIAIAKLCGIIICKSCWHEIIPDICHCGDLVAAHGMGSGHSPVPQGCTCGYSNAPSRKASEPECPDYLNDLNAIYLAEKSAGLHDSNNVKLRVAFMNNLRKVVEYKCPKNKFGTPLVSDIDCFNASAAERGEALLKALKVWED